MTIQLLEDAPLSHADLVYPRHAMPVPLEPEAEGPSRDERALRRGIAKGLAGNDFVLRFQPRYPIEGSRISAVDGMIRWQHRRRGAISEQLLMTLAEKARIGGELHRWAIEEGARAISSLPHGIRFGLNVAPFMLRGPGLFDLLHCAVEEFNIVPDQLELSINETVLSTLDDFAVMILAGLYDEGVSIMVSHFGAALGSLTLLSRVPLDGVKLDVGLVRRLPDDIESLAIVRAVIEVAHSMGARVVAEGVETVEQRLVLAKLKCDEAQGPLFGPPIIASDLKRWRGGMRPGRKRTGLGGGLEDVTARSPEVTG